MFIDSHCHLNYLDDPPAALDAATAAGVDGMLCIGVEQKTIQQVLEFAREHPNVWATIGEHPGNATDDSSWIARTLQTEGVRPDESRPHHVVGVGEMGLDYYYEQDAEAQAKQRQSFAAQMALAADFDLPVVIHTRDAVADTLAILADFPSVKGVLHCFTESWQMAEQAIDRGYYISISGIVTFRQADNVREVAARVPADRLLIETDAPWLAPVPYRGKQNQPAYVSATANFLSELRGVSVESLAHQTSENFFRLFSNAA